MNIKYDNNRNNFKMFSERSSHKFKNNFNRRRNSGISEKYVDESTKKRRRILSVIAGSLIVVTFLGYLYTQSKSSYDIWTSLGNSGTVADFIDSLKGNVGAKGTVGERGEEGPKGNSAFDEWERLSASNSTKTESDFIASLKGPTGPKGDSSYETWKNSNIQNKYASETDYIKSLKGEKGDIGYSAFDTWRSLNPNNASLTESDFFNSIKGATGVVGDSAYEVWKKLDIENSNKSPMQFIDSLKGDRGDIGDSAYDVWRDSDPANKDKTEADFIASLKGEKGDIGGAGGFKAGEFRFFPVMIDDPSWLLCDGSAFSVSKYPDLYKALQSDKTPDLRGKVLAMFDDENPLRSSKETNGDVFLKKENLPTDAYTIDIQHEHGITISVLDSGLHGHGAKAYQYTGSQMYDSIFSTRTASDPKASSIASSLDGDHSHEFTAVTAVQDKNIATVKLNPLTQQSFNVKQPTVTGYYYIYVGDAK